MDDDVSSDLQKCLADGDNPMDIDEGPLINENSNGLSHLLTESEFNSVDAAVVDESSVSNQGFLNAVELSAGSVGDYLNNTDGFNTDSFDVGDNAVNFQSDSMNNVLSDGDSRLSDSNFKNMTSDTEPEGYITDKPETDIENVISEVSNDVDSSMPHEENFNSTMPEEHSLPAESETAEDPQDTDMTEPASENDVEKSEASEQKADEDDDVILVAEKDNVEGDNATDETVTSEDKKQPEENVILVAEKDNVEADNATDETVTSEDKKQPEVEADNATDETVTSEDKTQPEVEADNATDETVTSEDKKQPEVGGAEETEVVSEDELPAVEKPSVKDAENVSDDELPGPKPAELPADTEVVSEDELPASKKEVKESRKRKTDQDKDGYDPASPSSEADQANKKQALAKNGESKPVPPEKRPSTDEKPKKKLPELDKYWKVVNDDPTDFTGWTYLLQYVDQESDVEAAREAYDAFLSHYPYCYGYWRKFADYEKRKGSKKKCLEVLEKGLKAIPLSVDLWIHYLNHVKTTRADDHTYIRSQYERAVDACGLEFRSDRLWESYIKWEAECGTPLHVTNIYDRLLATPTLGYTTHFDNFVEHVMSSPVAAAVAREELVRLRSEVRDASGSVPQLDLPPGEDEPSDHVASEEEGQAIKERIIAARRKIHKITGEEVASRWSFEEGIKRPYFHVKPLERCQLKNWKMYLDWEKQNGTLKRALVLHERCLIACALYEEFWMRLIKFLENRSPENPELIPIEREVLERACTVHHLDKPDLHLHWAHFEETQGNTAKAAEILDRIEKACPNVVQIQYRRVNLERRRGDYDKCSQLYEGYISSAKNKAVASALAIKYARFQCHVRHDYAAARKILDEAVVKDPLNPRLHMQRLDLALHTPGTTYEALDELAQSYEKQEGAELEMIVTMSWRRRELAEELGSAADARQAIAQARLHQRQLNKTKRKDRPEVANSTSESTKKKEGSTATTSNNTSTTGSTYYQAPTTTTQSYDQSYQQQPYQPPWGYQQPGPYQHPPHPWPQYPNYY